MNINDIHKNKYLKYKTKYLELKETMFAGATKPKEIKGTPLPDANFYNLHIVNGKDTDHYYVKVQWINMS